jgi:hypothetical protein
MVHHVLGPLSGYLSGFWGFFKTILKIFIAKYLQLIEN